MKLLPDTGEPWQSSWQALGQPTGDTEGAWPFAHGYVRTSRKYKICNAEMVGVFELTLTTESAAFACGLLGMLEEDKVTQFVAQYFGMVVPKPHPRINEPEDSILFRQVHTAHRGAYHTIRTGVLPTQISEAIRQAFIPRYVQSTNWRQDGPALMKMFKAVPEALAKLEEMLAPYQVTPELEPPKERLRW